MLGIHLARFRPIVEPEIPLDGVRALRANLPASARIYNDYVWAGPLILEGSPGWRVAVDGRLYFFPDPAEWRAINNARTGRTSIDELEQTHHPDAFFLYRAEAIPLINACIVLPALAYLLQRANLRGVRSRPVNCQSPDSFVVTRTGRARLLTPCSPRPKCSYIEEGDETTHLQAIGSNRMTETRRTTVVAQIKRLVLLTAGLAPVVALVLIGLSRVQRDTPEWVYWKAELIFLIALKITYQVTAFLCAVGALRARLSVIPRRRQAEHAGPGWSADSCSRSPSFSAWH